MPPGAQVLPEGPVVSLDELHKRMQQTEWNASSIEHQLNDVRAHLRTLREHVSMDGCNVQNLDLKSIQVWSTFATRPSVHKDHVQMLLDGADADIAKVRHKVDQVQTELQISWMSLTTLQFQLQSRYQTIEQDQLETQRQVLQHLSGLYERLRHFFLGKEEQLRREKEAISNTRDTDLKLEQLTRARNLSQHFKDWSVTMESQAEEQCMELKKLRSEFAAIASSLLNVIESNSESKAAPLTEPDKIFEQMSTRIDALVQELKWDGWGGGGGEVQREGGEQLDLHVKGYGVGVGVGKRKLSEAFQIDGGSREENTKPWIGDIVDREKQFLTQKKAFLSGLRESFQRVRQRELVCATLDRRLLKARLLLEQAQGGCVSSDFVSMKSKIQIEQAYKELVHIQGGIDSIKAMQVGGDASASEAPSSSGGDLRSELARQIELNTRLKQQVARLYVQAERAEGLVAVERLEVDKLRQRVQAISERLKRQAKSLNESHDAAIRARNVTIESLREQLQNSDVQMVVTQLNAALQKNEELSEEREGLLAKLGGQDLDLFKLRNENVGLVVEKIAFEGSARALQEKMANLMARLSETKQQWKRFVVYCETF